MRWLTERLEHERCAAPSAWTKFDTSLAVIGLLLLGATVKGVFSNSTWNWWVWNADALGHFTLGTDLSRGGDLTSWHFGNNTYLLPDLAYSAASLALTPSIEMAVVVNAVVQLATLLAVIWLFGRATNHPSPLRLGVVATSVIAALTATVGEPYVLSIVSHHHMGAFLGGLFLLSALIHPSWSFLAKFITIWVTCFTLGLSDDLFIAVYAIPIAFLAYLQLEIPLRGRLTLTGSVLAASFLGKVLLFALPLTTNKASTTVTLSGITDRLNALVNELIFNPSRWPVFGALSVFVSVAAVVVGALDVVRGKKWRDLPGSRPLVAFLFGSTIASSLPLLLGTQDQISERYMISIFLVPIVIGSYHLTSSSTVARFTLVACPLGVVFFFSWFPTDSTVGPWHPWNSNLDCIDFELDKTESAKVVTQYWDTHLLTLRADDDQTFAQHLSSGKPYIQVTSAEWYSADGWYDAAILSSYAGPAHTFSPDQFVTKSGSLIESTTCGPWTILTAGADSLGFSAFHFES